MKYLLPILLISQSVYAQFDYEHVQLDQLQKIDAETYYDNKFRLYIKYDDHWYEMGTTSHHILCPCYYNVRYHKTLCQELSEY